MRTFMAAWAMALVVGGLAFAADNPLKKGEVGDWAQFTMEVTFDTGQDFKMEQKGAAKMILAAKDGDKATLVNEVTMEMAGEAQPPIRTKSVVDIAGEYDPIAEIRGNLPADMELEATGEGNETLDLAAGKFDCKWQSFTATMTEDGNEFECNIKIWTSDAAPIMGHVKLELSIAGTAQGANFSNNTVQTLAAVGKGETVDDLDQIPDPSEMGALYEEDDLTFDEDGDVVEEDETIIEEEE